jgi:NADH:ubiquinone oxidoreductase subunit E
MEYKYLTEDIIQKINGYLEKFPYREQAIIPSLHEILEKYRDIPDEALPELADYLKVSLNRVKEIVSFYDMFRHKKNARHHIRICRNLPCHLANYRNLLEMMKELTNADVGKNSPDKKWYIELVECIGSCAIAPAFLINNDLYDGSQIKSKEDLKKILDKYE